MSLECIYKSLYLFWQFLLTYLIGCIYLPRQLLSTHNVPVGLKNRKNEVAIVTGGNRGIGFQVVKQLLSLEMHVIIACRKPDDVKDGIKDLKNKYPNAKVETMALDLSSLKSVRQFAEQFLSTSLPLHLLINNSGVMFVPHGKTEDGFEQHFGINYLGHFLLTNLLLPRLKESANVQQHARVVNVSSCAAFAGDVNFQDLQNEKCYSCHACYAQSKLSQIMFSWSLQEQLASENIPITVNCLHPGIIYSDLYEHVWWVQTFSFIVKFLYKTPKQGADAVLYCACSDEAESKKPRYYENCRSENPPKLVRNDKTRKRLWNESCHLVGLNEKLVD